MISVIIPLYNKEKSIKDTISSVLQQNFTNFELLVVDDGSTDKSRIVVQQFKDPRIRLVTKKNGGVSSARNLGIEESKYEYLAFLDGDDLWSPDHLEEIGSLIDHNTEVKFYATKFTKNKTLFEQYAQKAKIRIITQFYKEESAAVTILSSSSFAFHRELLHKMNYLYDENLKYGEDVEFWYRILKDESLAYSPKITCLYNIDGENRSDTCLPIRFRFHNFEFFNKDEIEKKYLGKLVALIMIDYVHFKSYKVSFQIFVRYRKQYNYICRYFYLLILNKIKRL